MKQDKVVCDKKKIEFHLHRIAGQVYGIKKMIGANRGCVEILQQILAARASLAKVGKEVLHDAADGCFELPKQSQKKEWEKIVSSIFKIK